MTATVDQAPASESSHARGMAVQGRPYAVPDEPEAPSWPPPGAAETWRPDVEIDATDLAVLNRQLNECRARLFHVSAGLREAQRAKVDAEVAYHRRMRRALVNTSGGSADTRRAIAELQREAWENDLLIATQVVEEWKKRAVDVRDDLKTVENICHNARAQMDIR